MRVKGESAAARHLQRVVQALLNPESYLHVTTEIKLRQTHISYVFLTGDYAYKIKKPVNFGFLDYSTLAKRRYYCREEVRLNRRLAPEMYLGVVEITESDGKIAVGPGDRVLEYAVKMVQLPEERIMDRILARGRVTTGMVERLAELLSDFYRHARTDPEVSYYGTPEAVLFNARENFAQLGPYIGRVLPAGQFEEIRTYSEDFVRTNSELFADRIRQHRIRDGHGDLRAENICFSDSIRVFDCIEFNERFRFGDVASDMAFLITDLDYAGYPNLSRRFMDAYVGASGDRKSLNVINYYKVYRACVRTKIECFKLDEPEIPPEARKEAAEVARRYFDLAAGYVRAERKPTLLAIGGLMGTGKTSIGQELSRRLGWPLLSSDVLRKSLGGLTPSTRRYEPYGSGIYSEEFHRRTYDQLLSQAGAFLEMGRSVIVDASFRRAIDRRRVLRLARKLGAEFRFIECVADEAIIERRLEARLGKPDLISDGRWSLYSRQKMEWEPVVEIPRGKHVVIQTSEPLDKCVDAVLAAIGRRTAPVR